LQLLNEKEGKFLTPNKVRGEPYRNGFELLETHVRLMKEGEPFGVLLRLAFFFTLWFWC
jgi:hypothetical protein